MWDFVGNKQNVVVFRESCTEEVAEGVVLFVECEDSGVWRACQTALDLLEHSFNPLAAFCDCGYLRVSGCIVTL